MVSSAMAATRSAIAAACSTFEPMGMETVTVTMPSSISGRSTILVFRQAARNTATRATDTSTPRLR